MKNKVTALTINALDAIVDETIELLRDRLIYVEDDGSYSIFGRYNIRLVNGEYVVSYSSGNDIYSFYKIRNAVIWCIFEFRNKFYDSRRIIDLDRQLSSIDVDIQVHKKIYKKAKSTDRDIYELKIHEDNNRRKSAITTLQSYVKDAYLWQINRYNRKV